MPTAAIYCRISKDTEADGLGVARQEKDCRALAAARGWPVEVFSDNDLSAYVTSKAKKERPAYTQMLEAIRSGAVGAIVVWHPDRLHRTPRELEDFIDLIEAHGVTVATVTAGDYDLATPDGRLMARITGSVARKESEDKSRRLRRKHVELAELGRWKGGPRPYGYDIARDPQGRPLKDGTLVVVEAEADVIREAAGRALVGETLYAICEDLNARGVPSAQKAGWRTPTLRRVLTSGTVAGRRERGDSRPDDMVRAVWEPILDDGTWMRLRSMFADTGRSRARPARIHLLTGGIARCGVCGRALNAQRKHKTNVRILACIPGPDHGGCGKITATADRVEELVVAAMIHRLDTPTLAASRADDVEVAGGVESELQKIEHKLTELAEMWAADELTRTSWLAARRPLEARRDELQRQQATVSRSNALAAYANRPGALAADWDGLSLDRQRAIVAATVDAVIVGPATRRGRTFDATRVDIRWR